jgi:UDP-N-acetylglucosamine 1-carboxyvinyltransferase
MQDDPGKPLRPTTSAWRLSSGGSLLIRGGFPLTGTYPISGAKNAVLPLMVSALLTRYPVALHNIPDTLDVAVLATLFQRLGAVVHRSSIEAGLSIIICADRVRPGQVDQELVTRMRASVLLLGALLARHYWAPPAQNRTCSFPAYGSHLGCLTAGLGLPYALRRR